MISQSLLTKEHDQKILLEQVTVILKAAYFILVTYAVTGGAFIYVMWDVVSHKMLIIWGCKVVVAESLQEVIDGLNKNKLSPDLILSDLRLKDDETGIDVINSLRNQFDLTIEGILITGETSPEQIKISKESGYKVLQKPVKPIYLRTIINHYLSGAENQR